MQNPPFFASHVLASQEDGELQVSLDDTQTERVSVPAFLPFLASELLPPDLFNPLKYIHRNTFEKLTHTIKYFNVLSFLGIFATRKKRQKDTFLSEFQTLLSEKGLCLLFFFIFKQ